MLKVSGATLVEVLVAMTIVVTTFIAAMVIFTNANHNLNPGLVMMASINAENEYAEIEKSGLIYLAPYTIENLMIEIVAEKYNADLHLVTISAFRADNYKLLIKRKRLFQARYVTLINANRNMPEF